ncbi:hypothetical protein OIU77_006830 [Salix suchowensis]|nr:myb-related protein [Salix suchowensis]KAJ6349320.1 hypothetical protein OIU77_006830 [Salix suchowensis]
MGRAPCCEMMGLKKGPWTPEEDKILVSYIQRHGHGNWRALPKQAGLLRCGKSCRLRWINYLRPDIKRGNFSNEEEETIVKLHQMLGNRWSTIAARLPGRTDNEIKNYWHSHLKKRFQQDRGNPVEHRRKTPRSAIVNNTSSSQLENFEVHQSKCHSPSDKAPIFQEASSQEIFNGFDGKNDMEEFWYELLVKAGNSREVLESWGQFG